MSDRPAASIIERVRKILAKTQAAGATAAESETAFAMASRLLTEHNLTIDDVKVGGGEAEETYTEEGVFETGRWQIVHNLAYQVVRNYFFVEGFFGANNGNQKVLYLFGTEANVATARFTFIALLASAERLWAYYKILNRRPAGEGRLFKTGVMKGFHDKLKEEREAQQMERDIITGSSGGTALAIRRVEDQTAQKYKEAHPKHKGGRGHYSDLKGKQSTLQAGYNAGKTLNLHRGIGDSGQKGIGGR